MKDILIAALLVAFMVCAGRGAFQFGKDLAEGFPTPRQVAHEKDMIRSCNKGVAHTYSFQELCKRYGIDIPLSTDNE